VEQVTGRRFDRFPQPAWTLAADVPGPHRGLGAAARQLTQRVATASFEPPAPIGNGRSRRRCSGADSSICS